MTLELGSSNILQMQVSIPQGHLSLCVHHPQIKSEYFYSISMCTNLVSAKMKKFKERLTPGTPTNTQGESCLFLLVPLIMNAC